MISAVVLAQSLPLWAVPSVLIQNYNLKRFPDGTASLAKPASGCAPVRSSSRAPPPPTRPELSPPTPTQPAPRPPPGSDPARPGPDLPLAHLPAPAPVRHRGPIARIAYRIAVEALQPKARHHFARIVARRKSQGCVE